MNRRTFLAALASIPLVGRLVPKAKEPVGEIVRYTGPPINHRVGVDFLKKFYSPQFLQMNAVQKRKAASKLFWTRRDV